MLQFGEDAEGSACLPRLEHTVELIHQIASDVETKPADQAKAVDEPQPIAVEDLEWVAGAATRAPGHGW